MGANGKTVLLVEDNEDNRIVYSTILRRFGYEVTEALNGEQWIAKARSEKPDLILMDISWISRFPSSTGGEATQVLKHVPGTRDIPIIALIEQRLDMMFAHSERLAEPLACVMCDLDRFKSVNDAFGHHASEEFLLLLSGTVLDAAVTFAERVRKQVEGHTFTFDGGSLSRTVSFGVAAWPHPRISTCEGIVRAADDALYVAKETGRNRVIRFDSDEFNAHTSANDGSPEDNARPPRGGFPDGGLQRAS